MTISYNSGRRIQGLERTGSTITYEPDLSSSSGWTLTAGGGSATIASSEVTLTANSSSDNPTATFDLGATVSDTAWVMTFKVVYSGLENSASGNGVKYGVGLGSSATVTGWNVSGSSFIEYDFRAAASTSKVNPHIAGGNSSGRTETVGSLISDPYSATQYVKLYRLTSTTARMEFYLQSDYSDTPVTLNVTMANTPTGLQYLFLRLFYENVSDSNTIVASEFKIYNGITSVVAAAGDVKPTNVQAGSRFEETDTRKMYHYSESGGTDIQDKTLVQNGDDITYSGGVIDVNIGSSSSSEGDYLLHTLDVPITTTDFVLDFDYKRVSGGTGVFGGLVFRSNQSGESIENSNTGDYIRTSPNAAGTSMNMYWHNDGDSTETELGYLTGLNSATNWNYLRLTRTNGTNIKLERFSSSARSGSADAEAAVTNLSATWGLSLKYIGGYCAHASGGGLEEHFDNIDLSSTTKLWKEEGT